MKDDWANASFVGRWDRETLIGNPIRNEQLDILLSVVGNVYSSDNTILDLGIGSGQIEEQLFSRCPSAKVVGVDSSLPMIEFATKRLLKWLDRCTIINHDLSRLHSLRLPQVSYQIAFCVQVLHELGHARKRRLFDFVFKSLEEGGLFLILDRFKVDFKIFDACYEAMWNRWRVLFPEYSDKSFEYFVSRFAQKDDFPATLEQHFDWLHASGFTPECLHLHFNRGLIVGKRR